MPGGGGGAASPAASELPAWVPAAYRGQVTSAALGAGLPPILLAALLRSESGFDPRAVSPAGAQGIAQFMPATARGMGLGDPFDPAEAIPAAARLLAGHLRAFGSAPLALAAYNAGPGAVRRYGGVPPFRETQAYVARIMALAGGAAALAGGPAGDGVVLLRAGDRLV
jgi:soluble lytic murein transglycosylase-like protein